MVCLIILRRSRVGHPRVAIRSVMTMGCNLGTKNTLGISAVACSVNMVYFPSLFRYLLQCIYPVEDVLALIVFVIVQLCFLINILPAVIPKNP